jgi:hypothetical protein
MRACTLQRHSDVTAAIIIIIIIILNKIIAIAIINRVIHSR